MNELNYPNGPWIGFYIYNHEQQNKHRMDLGLTFANGRITGDGSDDFGKFIISGRFKHQTGECHWAKRYVGAHDVFYKGFREGRGIWGTWSITFATGGFHIWPLAHGTDLDEASRQEQRQPASMDATVPVLVPVYTNEVE